MTRPNTPPAQADNSRLLARVETLERALRRAGANRLEELTDVIADERADGDALIFDGDLRKWVAGAISAGAATFPITKDDGTSTATIDHGNPNWGDGQFALGYNELDAAPGTYGIIDSFVDDGYSSWRLLAHESGGGEGQAFVDGGDNAGTGFGTAQLKVGDGASQSAEIALYIEEGAASWLKIQADENLWSGPNAAPVSADLNSGWFSFWLDPTNGATKLKITAKSTDNTVVTGEVALA